MAVLLLLLLTLLLDAAGATASCSVAFVFHVAPGVWKPPSSHGNVSFTHQQQFTITTTFGCGHHFNGHDQRLFLHTATNKTSL